MYENIAIAKVNKAVNGIELSFSGKPDSTVLRDLKENGFRWHNTKKIWYARNTADNIRAVEKYVDLPASDASFGITPNGTVDVQAMRNQRLGVVAVPTAPNMDSILKDWYLGKFPTDDYAVSGDWKRDGTFRDLFDVLDKCEDLDSIYPHDSTIRERLFGQLTDILGCDYDVIYEQWLHGVPGSLSQFLDVPAADKAREPGYDLGFGHLGNGITVWNRLQEEYGDYKTVAHIGADRAITYYDKNIPESVKQKVRDFAERENPTISATQNVPVFSTPAEPAREVVAAEPEAEKQKAACLADVYDSVGRADIIRDSTVEGSLWSPLYGKGFYADLNACIWCNRDAAHIVELENAMRRGKECKHHVVYANGQDMHLYLANECGVKTPKDLYDLVHSGKELPEGGSLSTREEKGVEVFSPFVSIKPLTKLPEKWKKSDLVKAIMSGQVFSGVLDQRLTDDYAYDAAYNFGAGRKIDLPGQAYDLVVGCRDCYIRTDGVDENGVASIHFSYAGDMKTFLFDVNCDLAESIIRQKAADEALKAHNEQIKATVKEVDKSDIDESKVYVIDKVVEDSNTGKLAIQPEVVQGFVLADRLGLDQMTGFREAELVPDKLYQVANFFQRREYAEDDDRIVDTGNWGQLCSGKAVEELTREGVSLYLTVPGYQNPVNFMDAKKDCLSFINGQSHFMFGNAVDYSKSLEKLEAEEARVSQPKRIRGELGSLADIIGFAELKGEFEKNQKGTLYVHHSRATDRDLR